MIEQLIDLPPRGLALLHACQPQARKQIEALTDIVVASRIRRPAMNILCSGDFGWDPEYLAALVDKYSQGGRIAHVLFYLANGPAARHSKGHGLDGFGSRLAPETFRRQILDDLHFRQTFQALVERLAPLLVQIGKAGGQACIVPQLEDNQSNRSFAAMADLVKKSLPPEVAVRLGRNPCVSCWPGNEGQVPGDCFLEEHHHAAATDFTVQDGVVSNDGCTYAFPGATPAFLPWLPLTDLAGVQRRAGEMGSIFLLWNAGYQGLGQRSEPPAQRDYVVPTAAERQILIDFLQMK
ncbi:hypothetical protein JWG42_16635 [Desulfoprunum benzoelyticum]|uniref:Uncharacterized protein n=1 Tax=Desulfoprunum benzoelyticum TaxID=1506996 RepID=A0A840V522_9BACT|nr:hypothetical protein [Desulfoprunum benzoelyticum]MBB5349000.1 hypothetical protein [Desulfoprunum benzoelyticum]MBM9531787.1 hypothetical protein [Desulfoprunum benzoelyticum]